MIVSPPGKSGPSLLTTVIIILIAIAAACTSPLPPPGPADIDQSQPPAVTEQTPAPEPEPVKPVAPIAPSTAPQVKIMLIHHRGSLTRIGCCNPALYERDEFVVIQNSGEAYADITGWRLTNITKGYPTFTFPLYFPCMPQDLPLPENLTEQEVAQTYYTVYENPAQSEASRFSIFPQTTKPVNVPNSEVQWSSCVPLEPLDSTPLRVTGSQQGLPLQCILYPGQTILVFTDEVHCQTGGFSFNWGQGNIWNNEIADTAVLYDATGREVSRRSYLVGR